MSTVAKGNKLEDDLYDYLLDQKRRGELVFGGYPAENCEIFKKKKYYCNERKNDVEFDVVVEYTLRGRKRAHSYVVFECKNYGSDVPEIEVIGFSDKLSRLFRHAAKGIMVVSTRLQSGAKEVATSRGMAIVKYDKKGLEIVADRRGRTCLDENFIAAQIFRADIPAKSLKFSAYHEGKFFGTLRRLLSSLTTDLSPPDESSSSSGISIPFVPATEIEGAAHVVLKAIGYKLGAVDLERICSSLSIDLRFTELAVQDNDGAFVLGSANFDQRTIQINAHGNHHRERFTIAHEIGHFCLEHWRYLRSERTIETDLFLEGRTEIGTNYSRLEIQANMFAANLILPDTAFRAATFVARELVGFRNRGHGYIYVDDQPANLADYDDLLVCLSKHFEASKEVVEIKLKTMNLLTDRRTRHKAVHVGQALGNAWPQL
ncbi:MAG TPA: ImmA/IrrE family metallo-endopeptidase [Pseudorhizobium sp.]|nr:ImmA/IrrE family metallo-endopeptidase [Pseudorhizobium sp.]